MGSEFEVCQSFQPKETSIPEYPPIDLKFSSAHYTEIADRIMDVMPFSPQRLTHEGLASIIVGSRTPIDIISRGQFEYVLDEHLLGTKITCELNKGLRSYSVRQESN